MEFLQVFRKRKRRSSTVRLGQKGHSAAGPEGIQPAQGCHVEGVKAKYAFSRRSEPVRARARLNLTGGSHPSRREADGQGLRPSSSTSVQRRRRAHRQRYRAREGTWVVPLDSLSCRRSGGVGVGRREAVVRRRRGPAAEELRVVAVPVDSGCKRGGEERGNGQWEEEVSDRGRGGAEEARTL